MSRLSAKEKEITRKIESFYYEGYVQYFSMLSVVKDIDDENQIKRLMSPAWADLEKWARKTATFLASEFDQLPIPIDHPLIKVMYKPGYEYIRFTAPLPFVEKTLEGFCSTWETYFNRLHEIRTSIAIGSASIAINKKGEPTFIVNYWVGNLFALCVTTPLGFKDLRLNKTDTWVEFKTRTQPFALLELIAMIFEGSTTAEDKQELVLPYKDVVTHLENKTNCTTPFSKTDLRQPNKALHDLLDSLNRTLENKGMTSFTKTQLSVSSNPHQKDCIIVHPQ